MNNLNFLENHCNSLLLAEAIGWLHDFFKCSEEILEHQKKDSKKDEKTKEIIERLLSILLKKHPGLAGVNLCLPYFPAAPLMDLLDDNKRKKDKYTGKLGQYLSRCHNTAHFDKQDIDDDYGKQNYPGTKSSSPFGFERDVPGDLTNRLWALPWDVLENYCPAVRDRLREAVESTFSQALGDTRRPLNEVDLWSWGLLVGSLYKAALAGVLLTGTVQDKNCLSWRLLSLRVSGLDYVLGVSRIPDLLARRQVLTDGLDRVRQLLEVTYPLGSEVYRDENGSIYVVPDLPGLLEIADDSGTSLQTLIADNFKQGALENNQQLQIGGEIQPRLELEPKSWWGQDPKYREKTIWTKSPLFGMDLDDQLPEIGPMLARQVISHADPVLIKGFWQEGKAADICTVCGLRPQGLRGKAADRAVCHICEVRRADRSREWATVKSEETIWTDEVADANGRLALVVGRFYLERWLDGTLLDTLFLIPPGDPNNKSAKPVTSKSPSFSRLRRIWETTRRFWQEVREEVWQKLIDDRRRLKIRLSSRPNTLGDFHVYDLSLGAVDLDVVWVPHQGQEAGFLLSASNLGYIARQLGAGKEFYSHPAAAAKYVKGHLCKLFLDEGRQPYLRNPDARAGQHNQNLLAGLSLVEVAYQEDRYAPAIPILIQPRTFMMLVPADKSLNVLRGIKEKYQQEMGKVRDRLPLHLGVVYAKRRTPIPTVLSAGRAMLEKPFPAEPESWCAKPLKNGQGGTAGKEPGNSISLALERGGRSITWNVPLKMGDGTTKDCWYPYMQLDPDDGSCCAGPQARREHGDGGTKKSRVVHAADLQSGETVYLWPSTFDFEFLDTNARCFEVYYGRDGRRPRRTRPFYLEDLDRLEELWRHLQGLTKAQRYQVVRTIEAAREAWYGQDAGGLLSTDNVFSRLVTDTLAGASWQEGKKWKNIPENWQAELVQAGVRGELADLAELHMEILKE